MKYRWPKPTPILREEAPIERAPRPPALVYLAGLGSPASRLTMAGWLDGIAQRIGQACNSISHT